MNREDILRMADEAYELAKKDLLNGDYLTKGFLAIRDIHFHRLATAAEREACAKACEENLRDEYLRQTRPIQEEVMLLAAIADCAAAIRARGQ